MARWKSSRQGFLFLNVQRAIKQPRNGVGIFLSTSHSTTAFEVCSCLSLAIVWRCIHLLGLGSSTLAGEGKSTDRRTFPQVFFSTYGIVATNLAFLQNFDEEILDDPWNLRIIQSNCAHVPAPDPKASPFEIRRMRPRNLYLKAV